MFHDIHNEISKYVFIQIHTSKYLKRNRENENPFSLLPYSPPFHTEVDFVEFVQPCFSRFPHSFFPYEVTEVKSII